MNRIQSLVKLLLSLGIAFLLMIQTPAFAASNDLDSCVKSILKSDETSTTFRISYSELENIYIGVSEIKLATSVVESIFSRYKTCSSASINQHLSECSKIVPSAVYTSEVCYVMTEIGQFITYLDIKGHMQIIFAVNYKWLPTNK